MKRYTHFLSRYPTPLAKLGWFHPQISGLKKEVGDIDLKTRRGAAHHLDPPGAGLRAAHQ